jgi:hypothetical protein
MKLGLVVILVLAVACFDYTLVGPVPNKAPELQVSIQATHDEQLSYAVRAFVRRGTDDRGRPLPAFDSALVVQGSEISPQIEPDGNFSYASTTMTVAVTPGRAESVTVRGPLLAGATAAEVSLTIPVPMRMDPFFFEHPAESELQLGVSAFKDTIANLVRREINWRLEVRGKQSSQSIFTLNSTGTSPTQLRVPWHWMPAGASVGDTLTVLFQISTQYVSLEGPVSISSFVNGRVSWRVRIVSPVDP